MEIIEDNIHPIEKKDLKGIDDISANILKFHESFLSANSLEEFPLNLDSLRLYNTKVFELYFLQVFKIWKLFLEHISIQDEQKLQLFNRFLSHINIVDLKTIETNVPKLAGLIHHTQEKIASFSVKNEDVINIYYSLACVNMLLKTSTPPEESNELIHLYDCSNLFPQTTTKQWQQFYKKFNHLKVDNRFAFLKLMLVHYKHRKLYIIDSENKLAQSLQLQQSLAEIVSLIDDTNLQLFCTSDFLEFLITQLDFDLMTSILEKLFQFYRLDTIENASNIDVEIRRLFNCSSVWENSVFQSVFITQTLKVIFHFMSSLKRKRNAEVEPNEMVEILSNLSSKGKLWCKYTNILPNSSEPKSDKLIKLLKQGAQFMSVDLDIFGGNIQLSQINRILSLLQECVPLEYLSPINQLRLMFTITAILFMAEKVEARDDHRNYIRLFIAISQRLWDSVRSQWLYDYVVPSEYILKVLLSIQDYLDSGCYLLLKKYIDNIFKVHNYSASHENVNRLVDSLSENKFDIRLENVLMVQTILLQSNARFIKRLSNCDKYKTQIVLFEPLTRQVSSSIYRHIKTYLEQADAKENIDSPFMIEGLTKIFEFQIFFDTKEVKLKTKWRKLLIKFVDISVNNLDSVHINSSFVNFLKVFVQNKSKFDIDFGEGFVINLWKKLVQLGFTDNQVFNQISCVEVMQNKKLHHKFRKRIDSSIQSITSEYQQQLENVQRMFETVQVLITPIVEVSLESELKTMLVSCEDCLIQNNVFHSIHVLNILIEVFNSNLSLEKCQILKDCFGDLGTSFIDLLVLINKPNLRHLEPLQLAVKLSVLKVTRSMITQLINHDLLLNSHLFLVYNMMTEVNLMQSLSQLTIYNQIFPQMNSTIHLVNTKRPHLVLMTMSTQMAIINQLMASLMLAADETALVNATDSEKLLLEACSKGFQQTLTQLTNLDHFRPYAFHLLAHYLTHSRSVSVVQMVKKNLTPAILNLIRSIKDQNLLEQLHSMLNEGCREVLKVLLEHYDKYYRFKGYV